MNIDSIEQLFSGVKRRIQLMITRGVVSLVDSDAAMQMLQVKVVGSVTLDEVEHWEPYGWTSHPHDGAEVLLAAVGGRPGHYVAISAADRRHRIKGLQKGELGFGDDQGQQIIFYRDHIRVKAPKVVVESDDVSLGSEGGAKVARVGDRVQVDTGSSSGLWPIVEGSDKVTSI